MKQIIWIFGLSGAGKTTLSNEIYRRFPTYTQVDADVVRKEHNDTDFTHAGRINNINRLIDISKQIATESDCIVTAITPYEVMRQQIKTQLSNVKLVYVNCSIDECSRRDVKGLYKRAKSGDISNFTGISDVFELPKPYEYHVYVNSEYSDIDECVYRILT